MIGLDEHDYRMAEMLGTFICRDETGVIGDLVLILRKYDVRPEYIIPCIMDLLEYVKKIGGRK